LTLFIYPAQLHENPELGYEEFKAHSLLTDYLERKGFEVQRHAFGLETAFVARSGNSDKVTIGICSEVGEEMIATPAHRHPNLSD